MVYFSLCIKLSSSKECWNWLWQAVKLLKSNSLFCYEAWVLGSVKVCSIQFFPFYSGMAFLGSHCLVHQGLSSLSALGSHVQLFATFWTHQAPLSMGFFRRQYWTGLPFSSSRESSQPRDPASISCVFCIAGGVFTGSATNASIALHCLTFVSAQPLGSGKCSVLCRSFCGLPST